ncbi:MAG: HAD-IA family hydrolase [Acidimicrobiales bacterium]
MPIDVVLLDLDGVIRHFDEAIAERVEREHGLERGTLARAAFEDDLLTRLCTGRLSRAAWIEHVGELVGAPAAAAERFCDIGVVDAAMLDLIDRVRAAGRPVVILTNGTDTIPHELQVLGIAPRVDRVFNTADIGVMKPDPAVYHHVCTALQVRPDQVFFSDDNAHNVVAACDIGMVARRFVSVDALTSDLRDLVGLDI